MDNAKQLAESVSLLTGEASGAYPSGNSLLISGSSETVIIDPSVTIAAAGGVGLPVDAVINSHAHEDHMAGNATFPDARVHIHADDLYGAHSIEGMLDGYGLVGKAREDFRETLLTEFHYSPRPDALTFQDGHSWDLGGVTIEAVHLPGHTAGHSGFRISGGVFFLSDIDLTGFGPYYGDVFSSLDDFEDSLIKVREEDADHYVTFHHKGVIEGRERFLEMLDAFHAVIHRRHAAMLEFLSEPHTIEEMVANRFVYRPHVEHVFADQVERRTAELHVARMLDRGEATEVDPGRFQTV